MGVSFIIWENQKYAYAITVFNGVMFYLLQLNRQAAVMEEVQPWNKAVVLAVCILLYISFLIYFKKIYADYLSRMEAQNHLLQKLNRNNEKILSVISHDIRGPIANLHSVLLLLQQNVLSKEEFDQATRQLLGYVSNMELTITGLLGWSKNQFANPGVSPTRFVMGDLITRTIAFLRFQLEAKGIQIITNDAEQPVVFSADVDQIEIIVRNLISNAVKFSRQNSSIVIDIYKNEKMCFLKVVDYGIGISPENLSKIFAKEELITTYGTDNERGTGLGLKLSREYAQMNGGDLVLDSIYGSGTTCTLSIPA